MQIALFAHLAGLPHVHRGDVAIVILVAAVASAAYFMFRRVRR